MHQLSLSVLPDRLAVCRLAPESAIPGPPAGGGLWSVTRTADELSIVLPEAARQPEWKAETGWRAFRVDGTIDFNLTGIVASLASPLAAAGLSVFIVSTYDTDYVLVRERDLERVKAALTAGGHTVR
ncbi:MAG TPA: ACT domain-containing protein [Thermoanaerobaculia bacterium]|nr:ACT domain-containing protein [Thermoanaerobaculia bacterium]